MSIVLLKNLALFVIRELAFQYFISTYHTETWSFEETWWSSYGVMHFLRFAVARDYPSGQEILWQQYSTILNPEPLNPDFNGN